MRFTMHIDFEAHNVENAVVLKDIMYSQLKNNPMQFPVESVILTSDTSWNFERVIDV